MLQNSNKVLIGKGKDTALSHYCFFAGYDVEAGGEGVELRVGCVLVETDALRCVDGLANVLV